MDKLFAKKGPVYFRVRTNDGWYCLRLVCTLARDVYRGEAVWASGVEGDFQPGEKMSPDMHNFTKGITPFYQLEE